VRQEEVLGLKVRRSDGTVVCLQHQLKPGAPLVMIEQRPAERVLLCIEHRHLAEDTVLRGLGQAPDVLSVG
jgi:hypothetical protein